MKRLLYSVLLLIPLSLNAANFPFPQNATYPNGIKPSSVNSSDVQKAYETFVKEQYVESGDKARIKFDDPGKTVSEGIGYGMLIMVYMDNSTNKTQDKFDKLWKYYNSFLNEHSLMHWKINGFDNVAGKDGENAATDAELDVAMALMQAYKQWGKESYLNDGKKIISNIWKFEVNRNKYLSPGDMWDDKKNPSYFSTAALEVFKKGSSEDWASVITNSYNLLKKARNSNTGLVPDWCKEDGGSLGDYYYDATRTPWRIAWGYVWYGHSDAKDFCSKVASWVKNKTNGDASNIKDGYYLDGNDKGKWCNSAFVGAFACAGMVDASHKGWLDNAYSKQVGLLSQSEGYYNNSLRVIYMLLLSGNMPNFWSGSSNPPPPPPQKYKLTVSSNPSSGGTVSVTPSGTQFEKDTKVTLTAKPENGYKFKNWTGDASGSNSTIEITMDKDKNITAGFEKIASEEFTLNVQINGSGSVNKSPDQSKYPSGTKVTLTAKPQDGHKFKSWSGDASGSNSTIEITMDKNKNITAEFEKIQSNEFTLNVQIEGSGTVSKNPDQSSYQSGTKVTLTAKPQDGHKFKNWSGDASGSNTTIEITMDKNKNITAIFEKTSSDEFTLELKITGKGTASKNPDQSTYKSGTTVTLTAIPAAGRSVFGGWSGDVSGQEMTVTITINSNKTVTATFKDTGSVNELKIEAEDFTEKSGDDLQIKNGDNFKYINVKSGYSTTYKVNIPSTGKYKIEFRVSNGLHGASFGVVVDEQYTGNVTLQNTGDWDKYIMVPMQEVVQLQAGQHTIKLTFYGEMNVDYLILWNSDAPTSVKSLATSNFSGLKVLLKKNGFRTTLPFSHGYRYYSLVNMNGRNIRSGIITPGTSELVFDDLNHEVIFLRLEGEKGVKIVRAAVVR